MPWIQVEMANSVDDLKTWENLSEIRDARCEDRYRTEDNHPKFKLQKKNPIRGAEVSKRRPNPRWQADRKKDLRILQGDGHSRDLNFYNLLSVTLREDDVQGFDTRWDEVWLPTQDVPSDKIWKASTKMRIRESDQLKTVVALYEQDIIQKNLPPSYERLRTMVRKFLDQMMGARKFEVRNERTVTGTPAKSRSKALKGNKGDVPSVQSDGESVQKETPAVSATI